MSRFGNLELGDGSEERAQELSPAQVPDEVRFLAEAQGAFENGKFESALRYFSKVLEFNPRNSAAWTGQVRMLIELGEFREARLWADKALEEFPHEAELLAAKAVALARDGDTQGALAFSDSAIEAQGDTPYIWLARGDVLLARREARADFCFDKALALAPGDWLVTWLAARVRYYYEQFAAALKLMQQVVEWNAGHFLVWLELGRCQQSLGLAGPALLSFKRAKELNPRSDDVRAALVAAAQTGGWLRLRGWCRRIFKS